MNYPNRDSIHDVFLSSEREGDCDALYTSRLCSNLRKAGISVFWDDESLSPSLLLPVIQDSRISVVVISTGYARSRRRVEVLQQILEWRRSAGQFVLPVFLGVVTEDVRFQRGEFGRGFDDLRSRVSDDDDDKVERWRTAFQRICRIQPKDVWLDPNRLTGNRWVDSSEELRDFTEPEIKEGVKLAKGLLDRTDLFVAEYPMGVTPLINPKPTGVLLLGIWGMVGIGKTTIAKAIYNQNGGNFEGRSFLPNIRHLWEQDTRHTYLQERLLSDICKLPKIKIDSVEIGKKTLKKMLSHKRILVVLDDVNKLEQLEALCGSREWFGPGSMIIITTRDRSLLRVHGVDHVHRMKEMDENESLKLYKRYASEYDSVLRRREIGELCKHCGGLPLALEVLGSELYKIRLGSISNSVFSRLTESLHPVLQKVLKRCVDDLNDIEKDIFLDIACFLIGMDQEEAIQTLNAFGDCAKDGIKALEDQCLITIDELNKLGMHVLLRDTGRKIIHEQMQVSWIDTKEVFLSFRGEDTWVTFTSNLTTRLANAGIYVFKDDDGIKRGDRISISLLHAIGRSKISVVVLSRHYGNSRWCLQELEMIMECRRTIGQVVVPVFYYVDPSAVIYQTGAFGKAFEDLLKRFSVGRDKESRWRIALREIGGIAGIEIKDSSSRNEGEDIKNVIASVTHSLDMLVVEHPVGVEARVQDAVQLLNCDKSKDVLLLGIWGMGGSGKTTIANAIYNKIGRKYEMRSFLRNISEVWKQDDGQVYLQEKLLSDINKRTEIKIDDMKSGKGILTERLSHDSILLVLDDVDKLEQLNALCGSREWFGSDSIIIITTRDKCLLNECGVSHVYGMKELNESESLELLSWHAFKQPNPREDFVALSRDIVAHCGGLPLALEELGRDLFGKERTEWKNALYRYKRIPHPTIQNVLKRSFDGLSDDREKDIFLEIACFFIGLDLNEVIQKLNGFEDLAATSVRVLVERSLVTVDEMNKLRMHVLIRDMGREIFRQQSQMQPERSIYDVFCSFSKDTHSFTSCLIGSLEKAGISVYRNNYLLPGDDQISPSLLQVIQKCRIFVVVLSTGYTHSRRCLQELELITECRRIAGQFVLRVFLTTSSFFQHCGLGIAFTDLTKRISDKDKVESLKIAFARISQIRSHCFTFLVDKDYRNFLFIVEIVLDDLIQSPHPVLQKVLKRCVNDLNNTEKGIFLDIACFFIGMDREEVIQTLNAFGNLAERGINALEDQCLVTFDEMNKVRMHVLLQDIGREAFREQMRGKPESWNYDVFLSFRGEDTRAAFTSHLYTSLANAGIRVFKDNEEIRRGDWVSISLLQAIKSSRIFVVVLSRHYANSRWCLQELENIMVCREAVGRVVVPVFYGVDPSAVRNQTGEFGEAFKDLLQRFSNERNKEESWKRAFHLISHIAGFVIKDSRNESEDISQIVKRVTGLLDIKVLSVAQHPVGVKSRVERVIELLNCQQSEDVIVLGILGIGGIGKTTVAKAIYNKIHRDFEGCCFLQDIREYWERNASQSYLLQERLLSDIYETSKIRIQSIDSGKVILKERLRHRKVLLVLDDVTKLAQLRSLCASRDWFGPGSRIVITTRDQSLLKVLGVDHMFRMSEMDKDESIEHFSWHAFNEANPKEAFVKISEEVVAYCGGLPLAHEVIGSYLFGKEIKAWKRVLDKLKIIPNHEVQKKLKISFDGLDDHIQKEIFLDIAFFFIGMDQNDVVHILNGCGLYMGDEISDLVDRSLVFIDNKNKLRMHDLLRDMGREIVREQTPEPEERSRLWFHEEVLDVLTKQKGTQAIKGMVLKLPGSKSISLPTKEFKNMKKLKLLQLARVKLQGDFEYLSEDLRWLYWHEFPLTCIPPDFYRESLVSIELESSSVEQVWEEALFMEKLKVLNLAHSHHLTQTPDFSYLPNLEKLLLNDCPSLCAISDTIGDLNRILLINLEDCTSIPNLPRSMYKLKSLETLIISGCSMIDKLEEDLEQMESLITLIADRTNIKQVPFSIVRSKGIRYISMCGYEGFSRDVFPSLIWSWMTPTNVLSFSSLVQAFVCSELVSSGVPKLRSSWVECSLSKTQGVKRILDILDATYCKEIEAATTTSQVLNSTSSPLIDFPSQFRISGSTKSLLIEIGMKSQVTGILRERILQKLTTRGPDDCLLPSDNYPTWFSFNSEDSSVIFEVPCLNGCNLKAMTLCIVYSSSLDTTISECLENVLITNCSKSTIQVFKPGTLASSEDKDWQSFISDLEPGNRVEIRVLSGYGFIVKKATVYLVSHTPIEQNMWHVILNKTWSMLLFLVVVTRRQIRVPIHQLNKTWSTLLFQVVMILFLVVMTRRQIRDVFGGDITTHTN